MPSWKKVLISGSDAALNTLNVSTALTASGLIYPTVDGTPGQTIVTDGTGSLSFATIVSGIGSTTKLNQTLAATTWSFAHNLNEQYPVVTIYDSNDEVIIPEKIDAVDANNLAIYFSTARIGRAVAVVGGTTVSASLSQTASYVEYDNVVNRPTLISESIQIASDISGSFTSISSSIAGDIEDIIDGTTTVTSASYALTASYVNPLTQNVDITGSLLVSSGSTIVDINSSLGGFIEIIDSTNNNIGIALTGQAYGVAGWTGPSLWINDPTDSYPAVIGFQNKATWTDGRVTFLTPISASNGITGSLLGTASYAVNANLLDGLNSAQFLRNDQSGTLTGDLTVTGTITAQEFHTELVSSSILYESGSTKFGDTTDDNHEFTGSVAINGTLDLKSANVSYQENTDVDSGGTEVVATVSSTLYTAAFFDYVVKQGTNLRAGTVTAVHDGTNIEYTDVATQDLGSTYGVEFTCDLSGGNLRLNASVLTDNWSIKVIARAL